MNKFLARNEVLISIILINIVLLPSWSCHTCLSPIETKIKRAKDLIYARYFINRLSSTFINTRGSFSKWPTREIYDFSRFGGENEIPRWFRNRRTAYLLKRNNGFSNHRNYACQGSLCRFNVSIIIRFVCLSHGTSLREQLRVGFRFVAA